MLAAYCAVYRLTNTLYSVVIIHLYMLAVHCAVYSLTSTLYILTYTTYSVVRIPILTLQCKTSHLYTARYLNLTEAVLSFLGLLIGYS